jgi:hypothetical protein
MEAGVIYGDRYALKWIEKSRDKGATLNLFQEQIKIIDPWISNKKEAYYCSDCRKMIIDIDDSVE